LYYLRHKTLGIESIKPKSLTGNIVIILILCQQILLHALISMCRTHYATRAFNSFWVIGSNVENPQARNSGNIIYSYNICQYGESIASIQFSAGDFVKFGFPMAYTATVLSWGLVDYEAGFTSAGAYSVVMVRV